MSKEQNYSQALDELNEIGFCRSRLRMTEEEVSKIIGQIGEQQ
jgi:hypothetical protein